jgi:signal transduction histidine kinase
VLIALAILTVCVFYTYVGMVLAANPRFGFDGNWVVYTIEPCDTSFDWCRENQASLQVGDQIISIGGLSYTEFAGNYLAVPFDGYQPGDVVPITISDLGNVRTIYWRMPPERSTFQFESAFSLWLFAPFWLAGSIALLFLRPRDGRWRVLVTYYYLIAIWLATGLFSTSGVAGITLVYKLASWLFLPVFLSLHVQVPTPLVKARRGGFIQSLYGGTFVLIALDVAHLLPANLSLLSIIFATLGSLGILFFRLLRRPAASERLASILMLSGIGLSFLPGILTWAIPALLGLRVAEGLTVILFAITLPALPIFYSYAAYKRSLGALEFRANRLLSFYSFALIYLTGFMLALFIVSYLLNLPADMVSVPLIILSAVFILAAPAAYARFQRVVSWVAYGSRHNPEEILRVLAGKIPAARDRDALVRLLADDVAPSLLIQQSALFLLEGATDGLAVYTRDLTPEEVAGTGTRRQLNLLLADPKRYRQPAADLDVAPLTPTDWVRLAIPVQTQSRTLGVWLLGRRDPDDFYPQPDINLLSAIASQVAPAIENMRLYDSLRQQAEELASLYRASGGLLKTGAGLKRLAEEIAHTITTEFGVADCGVLIVDDAQTELSRMARAGTFTVATTAPLLLDGSGLSVAAFQHGEMVYAPDVTSDARYVANNAATRSELVIPLKAGDTVIGVLDLQSPEPEAFDERTRRILSTFAERAALALDNARLLENLTRARRVAEEANQLKSEFLANTSHELRTPLAGILGSLSLVLDGMCEGPQEEHEFVATAHSSARNLLHIVNDILDIAKLEAGRMEMIVQPVSVGLALAEVQSLSRAQAEAKGLTLTVQPPEGDPVVMADPDRLRQILLNLVGNAIKFTDHGAVTIATSCPMAELIEIRVEDTGIGIAAEKQPRLFQPFVQADGSSTRRHGGTGLGLSIANRLANLLGGSLTGYSAGEGQGSVFTLSLPLEAAESHPAPDLASATVAPTVA